MFQIVPKACHLAALPLHGVDASRVVERNALAKCAPQSLMQSAAQAVLRLARAIHPHAKHVWFACGPGNNGGDGLWAAALWQQLPTHQRPRITVTWYGEESRLPRDARHAWSAARAAGVHFSNEIPRDFDLGIDALLGLGSRGLEHGPMAQAMATLQNTSACVLCIDMPSGLDPDSGSWLNACPAIPQGPRHTLSLLTLKPGLFTAQGRDAAGHIWWDDLGVKPDHTFADAWLNPLDMQDAGHRAQRHSAHKGQHGDVLVIGGQDVSVNGSGMAGAALLAARASLQAGAGRVYVSLLGSTPNSLSVDPCWPELMFRPAKAVLESPLLQQATVVCGCGGGSAVQAVLPTLLQQAPRLVLDADALNHVASDPAVRALLLQRKARQQSTILTPHPLEAARLLGCDSAQHIQQQRLSAAQQLANDLQCTVVLKGSGTLIASPERLPFINPTGNALLATAGTGDVLAGMVGAYWAQAHHEHPQWAEMAETVARHAVYRHGQLVEQTQVPLALKASDLLSQIRPWR